MREKCLRLFFICRNLFLRIAGKIAAAKISYHTVLNELDHETKNILSWSAAMLFIPHISCYTAVLQDRDHTMVNFYYAMTALLKKNFKCKELLWLNSYQGKEVVGGCHTKLHVHALFYIYSFNSQQFLIHINWLAQ